MKFAPLYKEVMPDWLESTLGYLESWLEENELSRVPLEIARFVGRMESMCLPGEDNDQIRKEAVVFAAFLCAFALEQGDSCIYLDDETVCQIAQEIGFDSLKKAFPLLHSYFDNTCQGLSDLLHSSMNKSVVAGLPESSKPFIIYGDRLYMQRYWSYEHYLSEALIRLSALPPGFLHRKEQRIKATKKVLNLLENVFGNDAEKETNWQKVAVVMSLLKRLVVLSGGPGTGKTWTVTAMMAAFITAAKEIGRSIKISLCAPTGKAASRINESVKRALSAMMIPDSLKELIPSEAITIHRLIGAGMIPGRFKYNKDYPLQSDVIIVDEASMVDLPLMVHLVEAMKEGCSLILIGDKDQLPSVEVGCVLKDICLGFDRSSPSEEFSKIVSIVSQKDDKDHAEELFAVMDGSSACSNVVLRDSLVQLTRVHRFSEESGIYELSKSINEGNFLKAKEILFSKEFSDVTFVESDEKGLDEFITETTDDFLSKLYGKTEVSSALDYLDSLKILCGLKKGTVGVENLNRIMSMLALKRLSLVSGLFFKAMPIVINRNDYHADLNNGDIGICWPDEKGIMKIWFFEKDGKGLKRFSPGRLANIDTAWALTIHRSQGSEFSKVVVVLPPESSPISGRELLYTAVTRAKEELVIYGTQKDLEACITKRTLRRSGLGKILWDEKV